MTHRQFLKTFTPTLRVLALVCLLSATGASYATHVGEDLTADQTVIVLSSTTQKSLGDYKKARSPQDKALYKKQVEHVALERLTALEKLAQKSPALALARLLTSEQRSKIPPELRAQFEQDVRVEGVAQIEVADHFDKGQSFARLTILQDAPNGQKNGIRHRVLTDLPEAEILKLAGKRVGASGQKLLTDVLSEKSQIVALDSIGTTNPVAPAALTPLIKGEQKTLAVLLNFNDKTLTCSAPQVSDLLFNPTANSVQKIFSQTSQNSVSFTGTSTGPYTINYSATGTCDYSAWASAGLAAARAAGVDTTQYSKFTYVIPSNSNCGWSGLAYMPGSTSWIASCSATGVYAHELGHNLSFHHAATPTSEYGDASDPMGGARVVQFNAPNRALAGWLDSSKIQLVSQSGSYDVIGLNKHQEPGIEAVKIYKPDTKEYYYVSIRDRTGVDANLSSSFTSGISVHKTGTALPVKTILVATLAPGASFTDATNGITLTANTVDTTNNRANFSLLLTGPTCTKNAPLVSITPLNQNSPAGGRLNYSVSVKNQDSFACPSSYFNLTGIVPAGFTQSLTQSILVAPSASGAGTLSVTSPLATPDAAYDIQVQARASDASDPTLLGSAHATYTTFTDTQAPTLSITSPIEGQVFKVRSRITISANAQDNTSVVRVEFSANGALLATDTSAPFSAVWNTNKVKPGVYTIQATAFDASGGSTARTVSIRIQ